MDTVSRLGLVMSVLLCAGAGYLFFMPHGEQSDVSPVTETSFNDTVREIEVPGARAETMDGEMIEVADQNHAFAFDANARQYTESYGGQHIGEGAFQTFSGSAQPHFLKPFKLPVLPDKEYLFLEGISENRVYEIVSQSAEGVQLMTFEGAEMKFTKSN